MNWLDALPTFRWPLGLVLAPLAVLAVYYAERAKGRPTAIFSSLEGLRHLPVTLAQRTRRLMPFVRALALVLLTVACARPQLGITETLVRTEGLAMQAALDTSGSMEAMDFSIDGTQTTRLEAVKRVFSEFVAGNRKVGLEGRANDLIGLVAFGGYADSRCPMTLDHGALLDVVMSLQTPQPLYNRQGRIVNEELMREEGATAIGDGLALSLERLKGVVAKSKIVVLLSDGVNNAGVAEPLQAAELAQQMGVKIYTIGIGRSGEAPFRGKDPFGRTQFVRRYVEFDEKLLKELATRTGGTYFHAEDTTGLRQVYATIDHLERSETERAEFLDYRELYYGPLIAGLCLLLLDAVLLATRFRALP